MKIKTDRRKLECRDAPEAVAAVARESVLRRESEGRLARALLVVHRSRAYLRFGCSSTPQWARQFALDESETRRLIALAEAMEASEAIQHAVEDGGMSHAAAAAAAPIVADERLADQHDRIVQQAKTEPARAVARAARKLKAEQKARAATRPLLLDLTEAVHDLFDRARTIASRKADRALSREETLGTVVTAYVASHDLVATAPRARRTPDTAERLAERYIPAEVRREVLARSGDRCEMPGCGLSLFLEFAHFTGSHSRGCAREAENLIRLCSTHHTMIDAGHLARMGTAEAPRFVTGDGLVIDRDAPHGRAARTAEEREVARAQQARTRTTAGSGAANRCASDCPPSACGDDASGTVRERAPPWRRDQAIGSIGPIDPVSRLALAGVVARWGRREGRATTGVILAR